MVIPVWAPTVGCGVASALEMKHDVDMVVSVPHATCFREQMGLLQRPSSQRAAKKRMPRCVRLYWRVRLCVSALDDASARALELIRSSAALFARVPAPSLPLHALITMRAPLRMASACYSRRAARHDKVGAAR